MNERKIDDLGRVVIPLKLRRQLNWQSQDYLQLSIKEDTIVLEKSPAILKQ